MVRDGSVLLTMQLSKRKENSFKQYVKQPSDPLSFNASSAELADSVQLPAQDGEDPQYAINHSGMHRLDRALQGTVPQGRHSMAEIPSPLDFTSDKCYLTFKINIVT